jgi:hypothetical protein
VARRLRARLRPLGFWRRYRQRCADAGIQGPRFLLSFDCDTARDRDVVVEVHDRVTQLGVMPTYAVPGALLEAGWDVYGVLLRTGATFMNHGFAEHSAYDETSGRYRSTLYYHHLSRQEVDSDIRRGHAALQGLGITAEGFRTPHFGSYQALDDLAFLHHALADLGYRWSSSTMPQWSYAKGPAFKDLGIWELPVTGCPTRPLSVLDSFSFRFTPGGRGPDAFLGEALLLAAELGQGDPFVVNIYADPSQVHDWDGFFEAVAHLSPWATTFDSLLDEITATRG